MLNVLIFACLIFSTFGAQNEEILSKWEAFKQRHGKTYADEEDVVRFSIWKNNTEMVAEHNKEYEQGKHTYTLAMNKFGDLTFDEFSRTRFGYSRRQPQYSDPDQAFNNENIQDVPNAIDWRLKGYVTPVKDQGQCGGCWAFSAVGSLEGQHFKKTGKLVQLSEQNLLDCSYTQGNNGCYGGLMEHAFKYVVDNHGIDYEFAYPYDGYNRFFCHFKKLFVGATATGYRNIAPNETQLAIASATIGPISVAFEANEKFQLYDSGVYYDPDCGENLNHGVLLVGYGNRFGNDYWLIKNSWGGDWGMEGYFLMARNRGNNCGIASDASYPLV